MKKLYSHEDITYLGNCDQVYSIYIFLCMSYLFYLLCFILVVVITLIGGNKIPTEFLFFYVKR